MAFKFSLKRRIWSDDDDVKPPLVDDDNPHKRSKLLQHDDDDDNTPIKPKVKKKTGNRILKANESYYTVKLGLNKILKLQELRPYIHDLVESVSHWTYHAYNLLHLHYQRVLDGEVKRNNNEDLFTIDPMHAFKIVSGCPDKTSSIHLHKTFDIYRTIPKFSDIDVPNEWTGESIQACQYAANSFTTEASNNMFIHYYDRHTMWIKMKIIQFLCLVNIPVDKLQHLYRFINPIAYVIYKRSVCIKSDMMDITMENKKKSKKESRKESNDEPCDEKVTNILEDMVSEIVDTKLASKETMSMFSLYIDELVDCARKVIATNNGKDAFPVTESQLQKWWTYYLPWMRYILNDVSKWHTKVQCMMNAKSITSDNGKYLLRGYRLFSIVPHAEIGIRHITIDTRCLYGLMRHVHDIKTLGSESKFREDKEKWWNHAFHKHESKRDPQFSIRVNQITASVGYVRTSKTMKAEEMDESKDESKEEKKVKKKKGTRREPKKTKKNSKSTEWSEPVPDGTLIVGLDPGKRDIFSTSCRVEGKKFNTICSRMSGGEYRFLSGAHKRTMRSTKWISRITNSRRERKEDQLTHKVCSSKELFRYFQSIAIDFKKLWNIKKKVRQQRLKFDAYIRSNKTIDVACKRILREPLEESKGRKVVIAFGQARFNGTRGCNTAPTKRLYERLSKVHKDKCIVMDTDEFRTSSMCPQCGSQLCNLTGPQLEGRKSKKPKKPDKEGNKVKEEVKEEKKITTRTTNSIYSLKACQKCFIVLHRDYVGSTNIAFASSIMNSTGNRPEYLSRGKPAIVWTSHDRKEFSTICLRIRQQASRE